MIYCTKQICASACVTFGSNVKKVDLCIKMEVYNVNFDVSFGIHFDTYFERSGGFYGKI